MWKYPRVNDNWELLLSLGLVWQGVGAAAGNHADSSAWRDQKWKITWLLPPPFLLLLAKAPQWPNSIGSQKAKGPGATIQVGKPPRPQSRSENGVEGTIRGNPAQHFSENMHLRRQEEDGKNCWRPVYEEKEGLVCLEKAEESWVLSLCCWCCSCWWWWVAVVVCVCVFVCLCVYKTEYFYSFQSLPL